MMVGGKTGGREEGNRLPREQPNLWPDFIILDASNQLTGTFTVMLHVKYPSLVNANKL